MKSKLFFIAIALVISSTGFALSESVESDSVSPDQVSETVQSDTVPVQSLEDVSKPPEQLSETVDEANESAEKKMNSDEIPQKPLGVREAEGKVIGEPISE